MLGKPNRFAFDLLIQDHIGDVYTDEMKDKFLMIGDNLNTDIKFGKEIGIDTALVFTGITRENDESDQKRIDTIKPTFIAKDCRELFSMKVSYY